MSDLISRQDAIIVIKDIPFTELKNHDKKFIEIVVEYPKICSYPEYKGKPYYTIKYSEKDEIFIGFGTYKPEVLSQYLQDYFISSVEPELHRCRECKWSQCHIDLDKYGRSKLYWYCFNWEGETDEEGFCHEWERRI